MARLAEEIEFVALAFIEFVALAFIEFVALAFIEFVALAFARSEPILHLLSLWQTLVAQEGTTTLVQ